MSAKRGKKGLKTGSDLDRQVFNGEIVPVAKISKQERRLKREGLTRSLKNAHEWAFPTEHFLDGLSLSHPIPADNKPYLKRADYFIADSSYSELKEKEAPDEVSRFVWKSRAASSHTRAANALAAAGNLEEAKKEYKAAIKERPTPEEYQKARSLANNNYSHSDILKALNYVVDMPLGEDEISDPQYAKSRLIIAIDLTGYGSAPADMRYDAVKQELALRRLSERKPRKGLLSKIFAGLVSFVSFVVVGTVISGRITGYYIYEASMESVNLLGIVAFIIGLAGLLFIVKNQSPSIE